MALVFNVRPGLRWWCFLGGMILTGAELSTAADRIAFNREIRPILSDRCFQCHGPDERERKAELRLDIREEALRRRKDRPAAIVAGEPGASSLITRIHSRDPEERMPPADSGKNLTGEERKRLTRWIEEGAEYEPHWAFVSPQRPAVPWQAGARNEIDAFVRARLQSEGLSPSPEASKETLIRRATLDLTGMSPTPAEIDAFLAEASDHAFEGLVDRLLGSVRYGEHMASAWLDAARYSDTNGYNNDTPRYNWRYRDWVIDAYNRNLAYDQFLTEQLAGDLIPGATLEQMIATGFNRNHNVTSEGGIIDEEYRLEYVADRVDTTATVFMAMTLSCARCHDHKFDPVSQRDYYGFFAFFNQLPETGYHKEHVGNPKPVIVAPTREQEVRLGALRAALAAAGSDEERKERVAAVEALEKSLPTAMVMREMAPLRDTFVLERGSYDRPGAKVEFDVPAVFPPFPHTAPRNRLGLAQWLTHEAHPLTARGGRQSTVAPYLRTRAGHDPGGFRLPGSLAVASRSPRLVGHRVRALRLGSEGRSQEDPALGDLSAAVDHHAGLGGARSRKPLARSRTTLSIVRRGHSRQCPRGRRFVRKPDWRSQRQALPATGLVDGK